jgi:hypothetical protein
MVRTASPLRRPSDPRDRLESEDVGCRTTDRELVQQVMASRLGSESVTGGFDAMQ